MSFPTFKILSSTPSGPLVVEVCPRASARYLAWMKPEEFTEEWKENTRTKILARENEPKFSIPVSVEKYSSHDEDCYEPDEDEITVNYEEEFDLQWNPKVRNEVANLTQYEQPRGWINVERKKKRMPVVEDESDLYLKYLLTRD